MLLKLNPLRFGAMFSPIWLFFGPSLYLYWDKWIADPILLGLIGGMPIIAAALAAIILRHRWQLEISPKGLVHHTFLREEVFEWRQMGAVEVQRRGPFNFFSAYVFAYPVDADAPLDVITKHLGRSVLAIFGDKAPSQTAAMINSARQAYSARR